MSINTSSLDYSPSTELLFKPITGRGHKNNYFLTLVPHSLHNVSLCVESPSWHRPKEKWNLDPCTVQLVSSDPQMKGFLMTP